MKKIIFKCIQIVLAVSLSWGTPAEVSAQQNPSSTPSVVRAVAPCFPPVAAIYGAEGSVFVEVGIDSNGAVQSIKIIEGHTLLHYASETVAKRWTFSSDSKQTSLRTVRLTFNFKLMPKGTPTIELLPVFVPPYVVEIRGTKPEFIFTPTQDPPADPERTIQKNIQNPEGQ